MFGVVTDETCAVNEIQSVTPLVGVCWLIIFLGKNVEKIAFAEQREPCAVVGFRVGVKAKDYFSVVGLFVQYEFLEIFVELMSWVGGNTSLFEL